MKNNAIRLAFCVLSLLTACTPATDTGGDAAATRSDTSTTDTPGNPSCDLSRACPVQGAIDCDDGASRTCQLESAGCLQWSDWTSCDVLLDRCTQGWCTPNVGCESAPIDCDDQNACTSETCDPKKGCQYTQNNDAICDDGDACTKKDRCFKGVCYSGTPLSCPAGGACEGPGSCDPESGACAYPALPDGTACSDGAVCTLEDACQDGQCLPGPCGDNWDCGLDEPLCECAPGYAGPGCNTCAAGYDASSQAVSWGTSLYGVPNVPAAAQSDVVAVAAGYFTTLALKSNGNVVGWGNQGYLAVPPAAQTNVTMVDCGENRFCLALKTDGTVVAWGQPSNSGELNVPPAAQSDVVMISAGYDHCLALKSNGQVIAWGSNSGGKATIPATIPPGIIAVEAGHSHSLVLTSSGGVIAWGNSSYGALVVPPEAQSGVVAIDAGAFQSYATKATGEIIAWGYGPPTVPVGAATVSAKDQSGVALMPTGEAVVFGSPDSAGLATPPAWAQGRFTAVSAGRFTAAGVVLGCADIDECAAGTATCAPNTVCVNTPGSYDCACAPGYELIGGVCTFACALAGDGAACDDGDLCTSNDVCLGGTCAGSMHCGSIGQCELDSACDPKTGQCIVKPAKDGTACDDGDLCTTGDVCIAGDCAPGAPVSCDASTCQASATCDPETGACAGTPALDGTACSDDALCTIGDTCVGGSCQPGPCGENWDCAEQSPVCGCAPGYEGAGCNQCAAGYEASSQAVVWGTTDYGLQNIPVAAQSDVVAVEAGYFTTLALKSNGQLLAWGASGYLNAIPQAAQTGVTAMSCGRNRFCLALKDTGGVVAWGQLNSNGELNVPASAQSGVIAISAGYNHSLALKDNGQVVAWGSNTSGKATVPATLPTDIIAIAAGHAHSLVLTSAGTVMGWGNPAFDTLVIPPAAQSGVIAIEAGVYRSYALKDNGDVVAWGSSVATSLSGIVAISAHHDGGVALTDAGEALIFGTVGNPGLPFVPMWAQGRFTAVSMSQFNAAGLVLGCADIDECADGTATCSPNTVCVNTPGSYDCVCAPGYELQGGVCTFSCALAGNDAACDDGNLCTTADTCSGGECVGEAVVCEDPGPCQAAGVCNPTTGLCTPTSDDDGSDCDDGDLCTTGDVCKNGKCNGNAVVCAASDECHLAGVCDPETGVCSDPLAPNWTPCDDGAPCTENDQCVVGVCMPGPCGEDWLCTPSGDVVTCSCAPGLSGDLCEGCAEGYQSIDRAVSFGPSYVGAPPPGTEDGIVAITAGYAHSLALRDDGRLFAWGSNLHGETTIPAAAQSGVKSIAAGGSFSLALTSGGEVIGWGRNDYGQITIPLAAQSGVVAIAAGWFHGMALKDTGAVIAWGQNSFGSTVVPAAASAGIVAIASGSMTSMALTATGQVLTWGWDGPGLVSSLPPDAQSGIVAIAGGADHLMALTGTGRVITWGGYYAGPVPAAASTGITAIAGGVDYSYALNGAGHIIPWGYGYGATYLPPVAIQGRVTAIASGSAHGVAIVHDCGDVDECDEDTAECGPNSLCVNTVGSYDCVCAPGFVLVEGLCVAFCEASPSGTSCDDGDPCTTEDACDAGACAGVTVVCGDDGNACTTGGKCDPKTGQCVYSPLPDGISCNDGNACTTKDACKSGVCVAVPVTCAAPAPCRRPGVCKPETGLCVYDTLQDGTSCDDGDDCTKGDACKTGVCAAGADICP